jgi:hypothetical protein
MTPEQRRKQDELAHIVYESARVWKEKNPESLPQGWEAVTLWKKENSGKSRQVKNRKGVRYQQNIYGDGSSEITRATTQA